MMSSSGVEGQNRNSPEKSGGYYGRECERSRGGNRDRDTVVISPTKKELYSNRLNSQ